MVIHAYQEMYLRSMKRILGDAFDYAVNTCHISGSDFVKLFVVSTVSRKMENGEPNYILGKSGIEAVQDILRETTGKYLDNEPLETFSRSKEYWIGWAIAHYQWYSMRKYSEIFQVFSFADLERMYYTLHEADISKFIDIVDRRMREHFSNTNLKRIRMTYGCTQAELAKWSGVSLRSIQMYEQRKKDINRASAENIFKISKILGCTMEDLMEV